MTVECLQCSSCGALFPEDEVDEIDPSDMDFEHPEDWEAFEAGALDGAWECSACGTVNYPN